MHFYGNLITPMHLNIYGGLLLSTKYLIVIIQLLYGLQVDIIVVGYCGGIMVIEEYMVIEAIESHTIDYFG